MKEGLSPSRMDQILAKVKPRQVVALVDDDTLIHDFVGRALHDAGFEVCHFTRAEELLEKREEIRPDAVVLEPVLPGISGLSLLDELWPKRVEEILPILILSKKDDIRAKLLAFRRGAWDYMTKPVDAEEVAVRVRAMTRAKILQEMVQLSAVSDPLTSLHNQRFLLIWLEKEIQRVKRYGLESSCLLLDIDGFRQINSKQGERFGDYLLKELAELMTRNLRGSDVIGRMENDEFLIALPGTSKEQAMVVVRRLRRLASQKDFKWEKKTVTPSFSMGITNCKPRDTVESNGLLERAREALSNAKAVGTAQTVVLTSD